MNRKLSGTAGGGTTELVTRLARDGSTTVLATTGRVLNRRALIAGRALLLGFDALRAIKHAARSRIMILRQLDQVGFGSLFVLSLIAGLTGMIMAVQIGFALRGYGDAANDLLGGLIAVTFARELGPIWAAVIVLARVGASMAAELGTMAVNEEVDALRVMSIDPVRYLVMPRIISLIIAMPVLALTANFVGTIGGMVVAGSQFDQTTAQYMESMSKALNATDIISGMIKASLFGAIIGTIACDCGINTTDGAEGVGRSTTTSVVLNVIFVLVADLILTWVVQVPLKTLLPQ